MAELNELQTRLWGQMLDLIRGFRMGKINYYEFVGALEGALDAGDFRDEDLIERWYDAWTPLEMVRAQKGNSVTAKEVEHYISQMERYLQDILDKQGGRIN